MGKRKNRAVGHVARPDSRPILAGAVGAVLFFVHGQLVDRQVIEISLEAAGADVCAEFGMLLDRLGLRVRIAFYYVLRIPGVGVRFVDLAGVVPLADIAEAVGHRNLHISVRTFRLSAEEMHRVGLVQILPLVFLLAAVADVLHDGAVVPGVTFHRSARLSVLAPLHLPLAVVVPDIGHYAVALLRIFTDTVGAELNVFREAHRLEVPFQIRAVHFVDIITPRHSVRREHGLPEEAAERGVVVLHQIGRNFIVLGEVLVRRADVRIVGLQEVVESLTVGEDVVEALVTPAAFDRFPTICRDVREQHHQTALRHTSEVVLYPLQLVLVQIADIVTGVVEHVVHHDVMHLALVEGVIGRAEEIGVELLGVFVCLRIPFVVVVAHQGEEGETCLGRGFVDVQGHSAPPVADYVAAGHAESGHARFVRDLRRVRRRLLDEVYLFVFIDLDVRPDHEKMPGLINSSANEIEIRRLTLSFTDEFAVEERSSVPFGCLEPGGDG